MMFSKIYGQKPTKSKLEPISNQLQRWKTVKVWVSVLMSFVSQILNHGEKIDQKSENRVSDSIFRCLGG